MSAPVIPRNLSRSIALAFPLRWSARRAFRIPTRPRGPYPIEWNPGSGTYGEDWDEAPRDPDGVIMTGGGYHPVRIAQYGLHRHGRWCETGAEDDRAAFLAQAEWLARNQRVRNGILGCYVYDFPNARYGAGRGWISAMAQGEAISLLLRAADVEDADRFLSAAAGAAEPFRHEIAAGGVVFRTRGGDAFLEEVAALPASHILNGHMFALWGLLELLDTNEEAWLRQLATDATRTLQRLLPLFDSGYWSYYCLLGTPSGFRHVAVLKYHAFHIAQLRVTATLVGDDYFNEVAARWEGYAQSPVCRAHAIANTLAGLIPRFLTRTDRVAGGAIDLLPKLAHV